VLEDVENLPGPYMTKPYFRASCRRQSTNVGIVHTVMPTIAATVGKKYNRTIQSRVGFFKSVEEADKAVDDLAHAVGASSRVRGCENTGAGLSARRTWRLRTSLISRFERNCTKCAATTSNYLIAKFKGKDVRSGWPEQHKNESIRQSSTAKQYINNISADKFLWRILYYHQV